MKALVSIIIPAFNAGKFISETLDSIVSQNYQHWEIIVIDDGSTDNTARIIKEYCNHDDRIKYFYQDNKGCSSAKKAGLMYANGAFIQYLDADDILSRNKIEEQVTALSNQPLKIAVCKTKTFSVSINEADSTEIDTEFLYDTDDSLLFLLNLYGLNGKDGMIQPNAFMMSRQLMENTGPWDESLSPSPDEDGEYFCRALLACKGIIFTPSGINYYRKPLNASNSLSKQVSPRHAAGALRSLQLIAKHLLTRENSDRVKQTMALRFAGFIYQYSVHKDLIETAEREILQSGIKKIPTVGGVNFRKLAMLVGYKKAILFKNAIISCKLLLSGNN